MQTPVSVSERVLLFCVAASGMRRTIALLPGRPSAPAQPADLRTEGDDQNRQGKQHTVMAASPKVVSTSVGENAGGA
jgi:hypothetical protein